MRVNIIRGTKEIGGSCVRVSTDKTVIYLDIGESLKGEKLILPKDSVDGVLISHAHQDHYGELDLVPDATLYCGRDTLSLVGITRKFTGKGSIPNKLFCFKNAESFLIGDIEVTPYLIDHSAYDSYMFLIKAEGKSILYTGDFRLCGRKADFSKLQIEKMPKGVDLLICEGTTLLRDDAPASEQEIENQLVEVFKSKKPIFINASAQNIDRIVSITRACIKTGKTFVIDPYAAYVFSLLQNKKIPNAESFDCIRVFYPIYLSKRIAEFDRPLLFRYKDKKMSAEELNEKISSCVWLVRSSMQADMQRRLKDIEGATFIHSMWDGYWKDKQNDKFRKFVESNNMDFKQIHTSGHAYREDIKWLIKTINPKKVMPIHTESAEDFESMAENVVYKYYNLNKGEPPCSEHVSELIDKLEVVGAEKKEITEMLSHYAKSYMGTNPSAWAYECADWPIDGFDLIDRLEKAKSLQITKGIGKGENFIDKAFDKAIAGVDFNNAISVIILLEEDGDLAKLEGITNLYEKIKPLVDLNKCSIQVGSDCTLSGTKAKLTVCRIVL